MHLFQDYVVKYTKVYMNGHQNIVLNHIIDGFPLLQITVQKIDSTLTIGHFRSANIVVHSS